MSTPGSEFEAGVAGAEGRPEHPPEGGRPPSVDALARSLQDTGLPHPLLVEAARAALAAGEPDSARARAEGRADLLLRPVINATGVLLHTNLGRAPLAVNQPAAAWNLELDLGTGERGSRRAGVGSLLASAAGAPDAAVVNNGAGAVLLVMMALASGRPVLVSRGELVEIGGGFRVPEVVALSGAQLVEVGTTNRTRLSDYERALAEMPHVAAVLKVHPSNYRMVGFTESVPVRELATLGLPVVVDLGSGLLDANTPWLPGPPPRWLSEEPAVRQTVEDGANMVTFSGDKLLGGPQAGLVVGDRALVEACAAHPLYRALRPGALVLGALQDILLSYLRRDGNSIPFWRMATTSVEELRKRAKALTGAVESVPSLRVVDCESAAGGGSLPGLGIPSAGLALAGDRRADLRRSDPPVIARTHGDRTVLDLRSVSPDDDPALGKVLSGLKEA